MFKGRRNSCLLFYVKGSILSHSSHTIFVTVLEFVCVAIHFLLVYVALILLKFE